MEIKRQQSADNELNAEIIDDVEILFRVLGIQTALIFLIDIARKFGNDKYALSPH